VSPAATTLAPCHRDLLIGWGNGLRQDDGVGRAIAAAVERWGQPELEVVEAVQLTPELAPLLAAARRVLFVDAEARAAAGTGGWRLEPLPPLNPAGTPAAGASQPLSHHASPGILLMIAETLYGRRPPAWQLLVAAHVCGFGSGLSPETEALLPGALAAVRAWCGDA
jgi:hydrogenase maturation protease